MMHVEFVIRRLWVQPPLGWQHSLVEIDYKIFSMVILSLLLIQVDWAIKPQHKQIDKNVELVQSDHM